METIEKEQQHISIKRRKIRSLVHDGQKSAVAINLVYVHDSQKGISRVRKGNGFCYLLGGRNVDDNELLSRIKSLVLPPAWENVWICVPANGHLQATGVDANGRKQY